MTNPSFRFLIAAILCLSVVFKAVSQMVVWKPVSSTALKGNSIRYVTPKQASYFEMDLQQVRQQLLTAPTESNQNLKTYGMRLALPLPDGSVQTFAIARYAMLPKELSARFPQLVTCLGQGIDDPTAQVYLDVTEQGFHAQILRNGSSVHIDPVFHNETVYHQSYVPAELEQVGHQRFSCGTHLKEKSKPHLHETNKSGTAPTVHFVNGGSRKEYRMAMALTTQYTQLQGGTVSFGMSAVVTILNRVNGLFGREMAVRFNLIPNNDLLIYTAEPDPYTNENVNLMAGENQTNTDNVIGFANYDIGHVISRNGGGLAAGQACSPGKAGGSTGLGTTLTDQTNLTTVYHEIAHQLDADHTWNGTNGNCMASQYSATTAVEPGSGVTIMSYASSCGDDNLDLGRIEHFHKASLKQMTFFIQSGVGNTCGTTINTPNVPPIPIVLMPTGLTIPHSTPYELRGAGIDANGDSVSLCWEQTDVGAPGPPDDPSRTDGPLTRSFMPSVSGGIRTIPLMEDLVENTTTRGNILGTATRTMNFSLTVRDHVGYSGGIRDTAYSFNVTSAAGPFSVGTPVAGQVVQSGSVFNLSWFVNGTHLPPVNCSHVAIKLSLDGGKSFPIILAASTPNDGFQSVSFPDTTTATARIRIEAQGNIFFDINNGNFRIEKYCGLMSVCSGEFGNHFISQVRFNTLNNGFGNCSPTGYSFLSHTTELKIGASYPLTITLGSGVTDHGVAAWIDYNNDGDFTDVGEMIMSVGPGSGARTDTVTIPGKPQFLGQRRMRVRSGYQHTFSAMQACFPVDFGETEDYTVTIKGYCFEHSVCSSTLGGNHAITRVRISELDHSSSCSPNGYSDFTTTAGLVDMEPGRIYTVQVNKSGDFAEGLGVWIDLNGDSDFNDPGEFVVQKAPETGPILTGSFRMPNFLNSTRMRIRMGFNKTWGAADACTFVNFGETEDYTVRVAGPWFSPSICSSPEFGDHYIRNFSFAGIQNSSACEGDGYTLYPESQFLGVVGLGESYSGHLSVSPGYPHGNGLWIDFGNTGTLWGYTDFKASTPNSSIANNEWDFTVAVPSDTFYLGKARVRVRTAYNRVFDEYGSTESIGFGETEDYYIDVRLEVMATPLFGPNCTGSTKPFFFSTFGIFPEGNVFRVELSDRNGLFTHPVLLASGSASPLSIAFPDTLTPGNQYKIRIISSRPLGISYVLNDISIQKMPVVTAMSPTSGAPGTLVTFSGTHLQAINTAFFGQMVGENLQATTDGTSITVTVPDGASSGPVFLGGPCSVTSPEFIVVNLVGVPVISHPTGTYTDPVTVTLSTSTPGAQIYYTTSGNIPVIGTGFTRLYTAPFPVISSTTVRAMAVREGFTNSGVVASFITITNPGIVATPVISPGTGSFVSGQHVTLSTTTSGASIYYTTNGNIPVIGTSFTRLYTAPFFVNTTSTIRALGVKTALANSAVAVAHLTITSPTPIAATPLITPGTGIYTGAQTVSISTTTAGATIYYTTNGNVPRIDVPNGFTRIYTGTFAVSSSATIRAMASHVGFLNSGVAVANITIGAARAAVGEIEPIEPNEMGVRIWPNPSSGLFEIELGPHAWAKATVFSIDGRKVWSQYPMDERKHIILNLNQEPAGIYHLRLEGMDASKSYRLSKQ